MSDCMAIHPGADPAEEPSLAEVRRAIEHELAEAERCALPLTLALVGIDGLELAPESQREALFEEAMDALADQLPDLPRGGSLCALRDGDTLLVVLARTPLSRGIDSLRVLVAQARTLSLGPPEARVWPSLAVGLAHSGFAPGLSLDTLVRVAERGLEVSRRSGGGRCVHTELYDMFQPELRSRCQGSGAQVEVR